ncbi:MAG: ATP-binding protein [Nitrososphaeria archaeon]|nr:ATP-binding protein [Nitrososphaeria archaeon]
MKILSKNGDTIELLASPDEEPLNRGDYLLIIEDDKKLLAQVIDVEYAEIPGTLEDTLRELASESISVSHFDPYDVGSVLAEVRDSRLIIGKFRGIIMDGALRNDVLWLPSRLNSKIERASPQLISELSKTCGRRQIVIGECMGSNMTINAEDLDGRLTIITGKKETGKSYLTKLLITSLANYGAKIVVLDVNGEYTGLSETLDGSRSDVAGKLASLIPGENFKISIEDAGLKTVLDILQYILGTPATSLREFIRVWGLIEKVDGRATLRGLIDALHRIQIHESVKEALISRLMSLLDTNFFDDDDPTQLDEIMNSKKNGGIFVVDLSKCLPHSRKIVVEYLLSKLSNLLARGVIDPVFLVAEEAHLYLRETYWDDLVTRMRHIGLFPIFVTNQPDSIPETIYRQADNIFLFNFTNESDLNYISKASRVDAETAKLIAKSLPPRRCLVIGRVVSDLPVVVKVREMPLKAMGETKLLFKMKAT